VQKSRGEEREKKIIKKREEEWVAKPY